ncbi:MEIOTIC F-BOX protein MOF-like [Triticum aestivum]|uniref:MEIOTIC F-BOX protein MOF-like n=1 Tax=Triticum aestivum TaxID=4565 RepID=UPI001D016F22|nr:MEIOTIC F-BOX protein MOF-like [Triticum aestivum]
MDRSMEPPSKRIHATENQPMEPPSKRIRGAQDDRLSDLPDCLLHSILSFLESRQVVRSSVLSRRWKNIWRSVPCLDIDFTLFRRQARCRSRKCCVTDYGRMKVCAKEWRPFVEFSDKLFLINSAPSLDRLRIHVPAVNYDDRQACSRWISRGVQRSPTVIDIHMDSSWGWGKWFLPDLGSKSYRLTRILLHGVQLDDSFAEQLRCGYPVLEHLSLVKCFYRIGDIVSGTLTHLTIDDCVGHHGFSDGIVVAAPRLTSLRTSLSTSGWPDGIYVTHTPSLVKASLCVTSWYHTKASFLDNLYRIFNIPHLELFGFNMMVNLLQISDKLPQFNNVRTLLINRCDLKTNVNIKTLDHFLQSMSSLEKLTLQNCEFTDRSKRRTSRAKWRNIALESQNLMSFKCDNLEVIEFKHSKDDGIDELFELLMGLWRNLGKTNIKLTKV